MSLHRPIDLVIIECKHDCGMCGGGSQRIGKILLVTLVDCLSQRDSRKRHQIRIYRCPHENEASRSRRQQRT